MQAAVRIPGNPFERGTALLASRQQETPAARVDIVLAIDASESMAPLWRNLAKASADLQSLVGNAAAKAGMMSGDVRLSVIAFRDMYICPEAFVCSPFCGFPDGADTLSRFIQDVHPDGAGGPCTSGLEALLIALHSEWRHENGVKHRIAIVTDSAAYQPDEPLRMFDRQYSAILSRFLPAGAQKMPWKLEEFRQVWRDGVGSIDNWNSRILLFTPSAAPWTQLVPWPRITPRHQFAEQLRQLSPEALLEDIFATL